MTNYYQQQPYPAAYAAPLSNGVGTAAMVLGIVGLVFSFVPVVGLVAWPLVILGAVLGGVGMDRAGKAPGTPKGPAVAGLVCSLVGLVMCVLWLAGFAAT